MAFPYDWKYSDTYSLQANSQAETDIIYELEISYKLGMNTDFSDIRFTDVGGTTPFSQYRESYTEGSTALFYFKVPNVPAAGKNIEMHYGNSSATLLSSPNDALTAYDDFSDLTGWTTIGDVTVSNNKMVIVADTVDGGNYYAQAVSTWNDNNIEQNGKLWATARTDSASGGAVRIVGRHSTTLGDSMYFDLVANEVHEYLGGDSDTVSTADMNDNADHDLTIVVGNGGWTVDETDSGDIDDNRFNATNYIRFICYGAENDTLTISDFKYAKIPKGASDIQTPTLDTEDGDAPTESNVIYIGTQGSNSTGDGSADNPYRTMYHVLTNVAEDGDTVKFLPGMHSVGGYGGDPTDIEIDYSITLEGVLNEYGDYPIITHGKFYAENIFNFDNNNSDLTIKRLIFIAHGDNTALTSGYNYAFLIKGCNSLTAEQCAFYGRQQPDLKRKRRAFRFTSDAKNVTFKNCNFVGFEKGFFVYSSNTTFDIINCNFNNFTDDVIAFYSLVTSLTVNIENCNFYDYDAEAIVEGGATVTQTNVTYNESQNIIDASIGMDLFEMNSDRDWTGGPSTIFSTFSVGGDQNNLHFRCWHDQKGPNCYVEKTDLTINADTYKHIYMGLSTFQDPSWDDNYPYLSYYDGANWHKVIMSVNTGYRTDASSYWYPCSMDEVNEEVPVFEHVHLDMSEEEDWAGTITGLRYGAWNIAKAGENGCYQAAVFYLILTENELESSTAWTKLLSTSDLIDAGKEGIYDDYLGSGSYIGQGDANSDIGAYGGTCGTIYTELDPDFSADQTSICVGGEVNFTNATSGSPKENYLWNFGNGNTSTETNPSNTYDNDGTYTVYLIASNDIDRESEVKSNYIEVNVCAGIGDAKIRIMSEPQEELESADSDGHYKTSSEVSEHFFGNATLSDFNFNTTGSINGYENKSPYYKEAPIGTSGTIGDGQIGLLFIYNTGHTYVSQTSLGSKNSNLIKIGTTGGTISCISGKSAICLFDPNSQINFGSIDFQTVNSTGGAISSGSGNALKFLGV